MRSAFAIINHEWEDEVLTVMDECFKANGWTVMSLIFDGVLVVDRPGCSLEAAFRQAEQAVRAAQVELTMVEHAERSQTMAAVVQGEVAALEHQRRALEHAQAATVVGGARHRRRRRVSVGARVQLAVADVRIDQSRMAAKQVDTAAR